MTEAATRRLLVPGLSTLAMLAILAGLGTWQVQRLAWKTGLLAQIDAAERAPAAPLGADPAQFAKVRATGRFRAGATALYGAEVREDRSGSTLGARELTVLDRPGAAPLLVDRGWVAAAPTARVADLPPPPPGDVAVDGYIRTPEHAGSLSAPDDVAARRFYTLDPEKIGRALGVPDIAPFTLVALGPAAAAGQPAPAAALPRPPNDHLSYAITWYGLAATLLVIFVVYARKVLRA